MDKAIAVINSCTTLAQLTCAIRYTELYINTVSGIAQQIDELIQLRSYAYYMLGKLEEE